MAWNIETNHDEVWDGGLLISCRSRVLINGRCVGVGVGDGGRHGCEALAEELRQDERKAALVYAAFNDDGSVAI